MFSEKDIPQIENHGLTVEKIEYQIKLIKTGMSYSNLVKAATINDGILKFDGLEEQEFIKTFESRRANISMVKFVPASGAATRMFKFLHQFINDYKIEEESIQIYIERSKNKALSVFINGLEQLPFFEEVLQKTQEIVPNYNNLPIDAQRYNLVKIMLDKDGLNYDFFPKGLLTFHKYKDYAVSPFEEHLFEAAQYASSNNTSCLHFTVSESHINRFEEEREKIETRVKEATNNTFNISYSVQKKSTDTIALTSNNEVYKDEQDVILFRPAGHGALLENLNELDYDLAFIKNIDNVVTKSHLQNISDYKKLLAGILLNVQEEAFKYAQKLDMENLSNSGLLKIIDFLKGKMNVVISPNFESMSLEEKSQYLMEKLNRPIRVCGMVKNEGEPGGGPFWVMDTNGVISLQIVESAQVDMNNQKQKDILNNATHFNPVDIVCGLRNYKGETFDLTKFVDYKAAFITAKTQAGTDIKALELPGLWNGSMAFWNTIFVEVPLSTFNPVKTVNDLLRDSHQAR
jgi:hypothetical protein